MPVRSVAALAVAALLVVGAAGCKADDPDGDTPDSSLIPPESVEAPSRGSSTETTSEPNADPTDPTAGEPSTPTAHAAQARDAVNELKAAWETGDQARARAIAPGDVVDALFVVPPDGFEVYGCDSGEFETSTCNFRNRSTEAFIVVTAARSDSGWQIATIDVNAD